MVDETSDVHPPVTSEGLRALARWAGILQRRGFRFGTWAGGQSDANGIIQMPYVIRSDEADAFVRDLVANGWVHPFDWRAWADSPAGRRLLDNPGEIANASAVDLARLLTTMVRGDRFNEGMLLGAFERGALAAAARRAAALLDARDAR